MIFIASFAMIFTSIFSNVTLPVFAATNETTFFEINKADEVINEAKKHIGKPYVWGAEGPNSFDCSGYVSYVLKQTGLSLGADRITTSSAMEFLNGKGVTAYEYSTNESNPKNAKKGDLVFYFDKNGDVLHMAFYMGDGKIIHCAESMPNGPQNQVMINNIDDLSTKHGSRMVTYKVYRVFPQSGGMRIKKVDESGNPLAGVVFEITMPNGTKKNVTTNSQGIWDSEAAKVDLDEGTYKVKEISTVEGYLLDSTVKSIKVEAGEKAGENIVSFTNKKPTGEITLTKYNEDKSKALPNTHFHVTSNVGYEDDLVTDANGQIHLTGLKLGTYTFTETQASHGYLLNPTPLVVELKYKDQHTAIIYGNVEMTNVEPTGKIILTKYNEDKSSTIAGTKYRVTGPNGYDQIHTTNSDGKLIIENLKLGDYTLVETEASSGYLINKNPIHISLVYQGQTTQVVVGKVEQTNTEPTATINLKKEDKETGNNAQGDATLEGAQYQLIASEDIYNKAKTKKFYSKGDVVATRVTDEKGNMKDITGLPLGHYQLKEITASEGYLVDKNIYDIHCVYEGQTVEVVTRSVKSLETVKKQAFQIIKVSVEGSDESELLEGAEFTVKLKSEVDKVGWEKAKTYDILTTDKKGYAKSIELPYGKWLVKETKIPDNVAPIQDFIVTVNEDSREPQEWRVFNDAPFKALIKAVKVDAETGKTVLLPDTTFKIRNLKTNEYVGHWVWFPVPHYVDTFVTDESGTVTTPNTLEAAEYQLEEIHAPFNYIVDETPIRFTVSSNNAYQMAEDGKTPVITVTKENTSVKGQIRVSKIGEQLTNIKTDDNGNTQFVYEKLPVDGAQFIVEANEDIYSADNQKDVIYSKGDVVAELTTKNGYAETQKLPLGKYRVYEKTAGDSFVLNKEVKEVELTYEDEHTAVVFKDVEYENQRQKVNLSVIKKDKENDTLLQGATFGLYAKKDIYSVTNELLVKQGTLIETVTTDDNGIALLNADLPINNLFEIRELKAPIGYASTDEIIEIDTKYQGQDKEVIEFAPIFKNEITKVEISKKDITNDEEIEGAFLVVYPRDDEGAIFEAWYSGQDGKNEDGTIKPHMIKGLEVGKTYVLHEESSPYGYAIAQDIEFTIDDTGAVQQVEMKDEMVFGQLKWNKSGEIFNQTVTGQTEFGKTESPVWNKSNLLGATIGIYAAQDITIGNHTIYKADEKIETLESDWEATLSQKLPVGMYYYIEETVPHGYIKDTNKHYFEIKDNQSTEIQIVESTLENKRPTVDIDMTKVLEEQEIFKNPHAYQDIVFGIFAREDIYDYMGNVAIEHGTMIYTSGIDKDGHLTLADTFDLPNGLFYIKELSTNDQYILNDKEYDFEIAYHGENISRYTLMIGEDGTIKNELARGTIQVKKVDSDDENKILTDVEFNISTKEDMSEVFKTVKTNDEGISAFDNLELGTYYIQEAKQVDGYVLNDYIYRVELTKDGDLLEITCENKPTEMYFSKQDLTNGKELEGATITVTDKETGKVIDEWVSKKDPHVIKYLVEGKEYIMSEKLAPKGYEYAESITFIAEDGKKIVMNDKPIVDTPKTGDNMNTNMWLALALLSGTGLVVFTLKKKKETLENE